MAEIEYFNMIRQLKSYEIAKPLTYRLEKTMYLSSKITDNNMDPSPRFVQP